jgi:phage baseplate assembly protein W
MAIYKGFSTANWLETRSFQVADIEVIKHDLSNHIFTRLGERVMQPGFGTRIPDMAFEPNDEETIKIIKDDVIKVINYDPRVQLKSVEVYPIPDNNTIIIMVTVYYVEFQVTGVLNIDVKSRKLI